MERRNNRVLTFGIMLAMLGALACSAAVQPQSAPAAPQAAAPAPTAAPAAPAAPRAPQTPQQPAPAQPAATAVAQVVQPVAPITRPEPAASRRPLPPEAAAQTKTGGTFRWAPQATLVGLDPVTQSSAVTWNLVSNYYDVPMAWDSDLQSQPQMLESWSLAADIKTYTFTLREGIAFHNGDKVTSDDVMASMERQRQGVIPVTRTVWDLAKPTMEKVDDKTFKWIASQPFGALAYYWANTPTHIMPAEVSATDAKTNISDHTGSGPWKFVEWLPGNRVILERNTAYVARAEPKSGRAGSRQAHMDRIEMFEVPDASTRVAGLKTGQIDFSEGIPGDFFGDLKTDSKVRVQTISPWATPWLKLNMNQSPLTNKKARQALQLAADYRNYMQAAYGPEELWTVCHEVFMCGGPWGTDEAISDVFPAKPDLDKAKQMWQEAVQEEGWNRPIVILAATDYSDFFGAGLVTQELLESLGAKVDNAPMDWPTVVQRKEAGVLKDPEQGGWHGYHTWTRPLDPIINSGLSVNWSGGVKNEKILKLREEFARAATPDEQWRIVKELQRETLDHVPYIQLGQFNFIVASQKYVMNFEPHLQFSFDGIWLNK